MGSTINNESTTTELPPENRHQPNPLVGLNVFYWYQIFTVKSFVAKTQTCCARIEASNQIDLLYFVFVFALCRAALWSPARKGLTFCFSFI